MKGSSRKFAASIKVVKEKFCTIKLQRSAKMSQWYINCRHFFAIAIFKYASKYDELVWFMSDMYLDAIFII